MTVVEFHSEPGKIQMNIFTGFFAEAIVILLKIYTIMESIFAFIFRDFLLDLFASSISPTPLLATFILLTVVYYSVRLFLYEM